MMSENEREVKKQERPLGAMAIGIRECDCGWIAGNFGVDLGESRKCGDSVSQEYRRALLSTSGVRL